MLTFYVESDYLSAVHNNSTKKIRISKEMSKYVKATVHQDRYSYYFEELDTSKVDLTGRKTRLMINLLGLNREAGIVKHKDLPELKRTIFKLLNTSLDKYAIPGTQSGGYRVRNRGNVTTISYVKPHTHSEVTVADIEEILKNILILTERAQKKESNLIWL